MLVGLAIGGLAAVVPALAGDGSLPPELQEVRSAVARYHSFEQAERDGYTVHMEPCVASPAGTMGIHAINPALMADDAIDVDQPEILLYVPKGDGELELVGVEYWKRDADQSLGTNGDLPSLFGRAFEGPMPGHARSCRSTTTCTSGWRRRTRAGSSRSSTRRSRVDGLASGGARAALAVAVPRAERPCRLLDQALERRRFNHACGESQAPRLREAMTCTARIAAG